LSIYRQPGAVQLPKIGVGEGKRKIGYAASISLRVDSAKRKLSSAIVYDLWSKVYAKQSCNDRHLSLEYMSVYKGLLTIETPVDKVLEYAAIPLIHHPHNTVPRRAIDDGTRLVDNFVKLS
jgi:hypothetical protein